MATQIQNQRLMINDTNGLSEPKERKNRRLENRKMYL